MTKQQELREGIYRIIENWDGNRGLHRGDPFDRVVKEIQTFEASQGVVLKVNKKLPEYVVGINVTDDSAKFISEEVQWDMERAGWSATESLIEEKGERNGSS